MVNISVTFAQGHYKNHKNKAKTLCLSLWLMRIFLGVNLGLGLSSFSLENHISHGKGVLGGVSISFILCIFLSLLLLLRFLLCSRSHHYLILLFFGPCWCFGILRKFWDGERLFKRRRKGRGRKRSSCVFSEVLWITHLVHSSQIGVSRDSCLIKGLIVCFNTVLLQTTVTSAISLAFISNTPRL